MDTTGGKWRGGGDGVVMNWAVGFNMYTLMCIKFMTNKNLLYKKIKFKNSKKKYIHALQFSLQHYLQQPGHGSNLKVHQQMNG